MNGNTFWQTLSLPSQSLQIGAFFPLGASRGHALVALTVRLPRLKEDESWPSSSGTSVAILSNTDSPPRLWDSIFRGRNAAGPAKAPHIIADRTRKDLMSLGEVGKYAPGLDFCNQRYAYPTRKPRDHRY